MRAASSLTRSEWLPVYASRASTAFARDARADGDNTHVLELERADPVDDRLCGRDGRPLVEPGQDQRKLVAAEPERFAALAQPARDLRQDPVADGMPEAVVDPLEVVDV